MSSESGQIYIFDVETSTLSMTFTSHAMSVRSVAWSPDSNVCFSIPCFLSFSPAIWNIFLNLINQLLLSASEDKRLVLHDVRSSPGGTVASFSGHTSWVLSVAVSPDGRLGLSG